VEWCAIVSAGALAISSGLWWLSPRVTWYVGASGVLHTVMAAGVVKHFAQRAWDRWILGLGLCAKLAWEQWGGNAEPWIVVDAHLYGALCGFVVGAALSLRTAIIRHRSGAQRL
jgi:membrane associated rhomboid family serine protease